jgi:hypothetical protein
MKNSEQLSLRSFEFEQRTRRKHLLGKLFATGGVLLVLLGTCADIHFVTHWPH